jgi:hypothetical protein
MSQNPNFQENNEQILNDIQSLQQIEQKLFNSLEANPNLSTEEQTKMIEKMNQLSNMRVNLYQTLSGVNNYFQNTLNTSIGSLKEQAVAIEIVENELNQAKKRLAILEEEKNNKIRLVEINTYFGDKYEHHSNIMKIIVYTLVPIIILSLIYRTGFLPNIVYYILLMIIASIGGYYFWIEYLSMIRRDRMNYQEYAWSFNTNSVPIGTPSTDDPWQSNFGTCIGNMCCSEGLIYDSNLNQCVSSKQSATSSSSKQCSNPSNNLNQSTTSASLTQSTTSASLTQSTPSTNLTQSAPSINKESFVNSVLTKLQPGNYKVSYDLKEPKPFNN